ncbi:MAG: flagellar basal-body MS-ring/collar protein FliF [Rhodocyclaceae bacterium]|nr:flagellar basal-body MS-ring/collar protein FliF [Rhodocyclaceae bacterium]
MANADTITAPASPFQQITQNFAALSQRQKLAGATALAVGIALLVGIFLWSRQTDYAVLFSNLEERDGGAIITALQQQNVPYKFSAGGGAILVPASQVHDVRLRLAAQGLPRGGLVGFELMENQKMGLSQFHEQVNFQRALEGELARTIQAIAAVASARVHLAIPKQTAFLRDEQKPTASVLLNLHSGRHLEPAQVAGIVHLVASSVPRMANDNVSVLDQNGNLLTTRQDPLRAAGLDPTQIKYVEELEDSYIKRIDAILTPIVGADNFKAQVTADVDFNQTEQTAESYKPNPSPDQAIRSQQNNESQTREAGPQGVPGALSNQPPVPATAPITTPAVAGAPGAPGSPPPLNSNRATTTNYELDRTIQHTKLALGTIKRLSVAVVLNHRTETDPAGKTKTVPLSEQEIKQVNELVREAMGFNPQRGDSLNVASSAFAPVVKEVPPETPVWKDPEIQDLGKEALKYLVLAGVLAFVAFGIIRPLIKSVTPPPAPEEEASTEPLLAEGEEGEEGAEVKLSPEALASRGYDAKLERARELARTEPRMVANLLKEWMGGNEEAKK